MLVRAQVTFQGGSNLPEDRFINTFHFFDATWGTLEAAADEIHPALTDVYETVYSGSAIGSAMSPYVQRAYVIRYYDLGQAQPRVPDERPSTLPAVTAGATPLPEEVAVVSSFHGGLPVTPNTRGRVYLGPFTSNVLSTATTSQPTRVSSAWRTIIAAAFAALQAANVGWIVLSTTGLQTTVVGGFVNNDLDTQRRRGPDATDRTIWPAP